MPKISVITPSIRPEGLLITQKCLAEQTFKDFEWLVEIGLKNEHDLNKSFNKMLRRAQGELVVFLQDYIKVPPNYLEKWWQAYQTHPDTFMTAPVGKVKTVDYTGKIDWDWRAWTQNEKPEDYMPCRWQTWEIDSAAAPLSCLKKIGGFDEELDNWWSFDNVAVGKLADLKGYHFLNYFGNPAVAFDHDAFMEHPFRERFNPKEVNAILASYTDNTVLPYLQ